ncbi:MAG: T9SS type A sorting domain-containing protein, partial [Ignavibacteriales bacterium]|nr:T9SS type A sorting domain-containing protein [Ignavibacteriales bacterium]
VAYPVVFSWNRHAENAITYYLVASNRGGGGNGGNGEGRTQLPDTGSTVIDSTVGANGGIVVLQATATTPCITRTAPIVNRPEEAQAEKPKEFALHQNYPNPFNPVTEIRYDLPEPSRVTVKVYDVLGREVATVVDAIQEASAQQASWDARAVASGLYFYRLDATSLTDAAHTFMQVRKMMLVK